MTAQFATLPRAFRLRLEMLTDWHVGTGAGRRGDVDRAVARDPDGLPYVPGGTVTGVWRAACELAARALDGEDDAWARLVVRIFGSQPNLERSPREAPRAAVLSVRAAVLGPWLRHRLTAASQEPLRDALTLVRAGVQIDRESGRAVDGHLHFDEMTRAGAVLWADCTLDVEPELRAHATALLCAGAVLVDRLGGGRRRGSGRCQLRIEGADNHAAVRWLATAPPVPSPAAPRNQDRPAVRPRAGGAWQEIQLLVTLLSPAVFPRGTAGNVTRTFDYLPGRHLLPILTRLAAGLGVDLGPSIGRGDVRVLNGLPRLDGLRSAPVPLCFHRSKNPNERALWNGRSSEHPGQVRDGYVVHAGGELLLWKPQTEVRAHNAIDDQDQRAAGDHGLYTVEALPAGTNLDVRIMVRVGAAEALGAWWDGLAGRHAVGRSSKDDYGLIQVVVAGVSDQVDRPVALTRNGRLRTWCLSDVVLRDSLLRPVPTPEALGQELATLLDVAELRPVADRTFARVSRLDSWQARWVLPRPSLVALAAGSVVEFEVTGDLDPDRLREVALGGVGERRAEGLGEVAFGHPLLDLEQVEWADARPAIRLAVSHTPDHEPDDGELVHGRLVEESAWRSAIQRIAAARARDLLVRLGWEDGPPPSQLGALRSAVRRTKSPGPGPAMEWLERLCSVPARRDLWPADALSELRELFTERDRVWELLGMTSGPVLEPAADREDMLRGALWHEAVVTLLDECVRRRTRAVA